MSHLSLYAQICLVMILGFITLGVGPIGLSRLFPLEGDRPQLWTGLLYSIASAVSFFLMFAIIIFGQD
jgi:hypothetical protein